MNKRTAKAVVGWLANSLVDPDKISDHYHITGKERKIVRRMAVKIRSKQFPNMFKHEVTRQPD